MTESLDPKDPKDAKDDEIRELKSKVNDLERSLKIQLQINDEVKKLLVASVGEDIEARVDFLTQDKARLAADLRSYTNKISRDFEEKEKLSVESNLWKSKFLACSLIVDDLARWKANLLHSQGEYEHGVRILLHEHCVLWNSLMESYTTLAQIQKAFEPLNDDPKPAEAASFLGLANHTFRLAQKLRDRLLKDIKSNEKSRTDIVKPSQIQSPAEEKLLEV